VLRKIGRVLLWLLGLALVAAVVMVVLGWRDFGERAFGDRLGRMERSPQWDDGHFDNPQPLVNSWSGAVAGMFDISPNATPATPPPIVTLEAEALATPPPSGLRVTWIGHSTTLVELDGTRLLTDPIWSRRASPYSWVGPRRFAPPPIDLAALPPVDAVVISHDHYDHLDRATLTAMKAWKTTFVVPLGVGQHLVYWGIPAARVVELDWWEGISVGGVEITCTPARHASGRMVIDDDAKLWAGYALVGPRHRVFYSGDTGLFTALRDIGERLGPFDLTMIEIGQYGRAWPDWHIGPEQAVLAHQLLRGKVMLPVHWGTFALAYHGWTDPIERALVAARAAGIVIVAPRVGQSFEPASPPAVERWWPELPWVDAAQDPIVSSGN
jgi:L-ascorbate metabolism protein UlaG (beta-lactamase superfamily)